MLWKFRRLSRSLARPMLALAAVLWLATALAPCFMTAPNCEGMDSAMPCAHTGGTSDCDTACLQSDSRNLVASIFSLPSFAPLLPAVVALIVLASVVTPPIAVTRGRAPDTPLHLQFARLLI